MGVLIYYLSVPSSGHADLKLSSPLLSQTDSSGQQSYDTDTKRQSEPAILNDSTEHGCLKLAETDPRAALELAINTRLYDTNPGLLENLTGQWAVRDYKAAHDWVLQQGPGEWRDGLMARVAYSLSRYLILPTLRKSSRTKYPKGRCRMRLQSPFCISGLCAITMTRNPGLVHSLRVLSRHVRWLKSKALTNTFIMLPPHRDIAAAFPIFT